ncbi:hypothetical protein CK247_30475, partial [Klebsiella pneumoniae]
TFRHSGTATSILPTQLLTETLNDRQARRREPQRSRSPGAIRKVDIKPFAIQGLRPLSCRPSC